MKLKSGGSISGFGLKFGVKLKSGGDDFRIWVEIWNEIEIGSGAVSGFGWKLGSLGRHLGVTLGQFQKIFIFAIDFNDFIDN